MGFHMRLPGLIFVILLLAAASPAQAAFADCPLIGTLENFEADAAPRLTAYD